jgi:hypothetical protein
LKQTEHKVSEIQGVKTSEAEKSINSSVYIQREPNPDWMGAMADIADRISPDQRGTFAFVGNHEPEFGE